MDISCIIDIRNVETVFDQIIFGDSFRNVIVESSVYEVESSGYMVSLGEEEEEEGLGDEQLVDVFSTFVSLLNDVNLFFFYLNGVCFVGFVINIMRVVINLNRVV